MIHYEELPQLTSTYKYAEFLVSIFIFYALVDVMFRDEFIEHSALSAATLPLIYSVATSAPATRSVSTEADSLRELAPVKFERRRNVYFMGLDALSPEVIAKRPLNTGKSVLVPNLVGYLSEKLPNVPTQRMCVLPAVGLPLDPQFDTEPLLVVEGLDVDRVPRYCEKSGGARQLFT